MRNIKSQDDITIETYLRYDKFVKDLTDEQKVDEKYIVTNVLDIFYSIDNQQVKNMKNSLVMEKYNWIMEVLQFKQMLALNFKLKGVEYGIVPNFDDITFAELVDLNNTDILKQMCILYRPITYRKKDKYRIVEYTVDLSYLEDFKQLPLSIMNGCIGFFLNIQKDFMDIIQKSLEMEKDIPAEMRKTIQKSGDGLAGYIDYVKGI